MSSGTKIESQNTISIGAKNVCPFIDRTLQWCKVEITKKDNFEQNESKQFKNSKLPTINSVDCKNLGPLNFYFIF